MLDGLVRSDPGPCCLHPVFTKPGCGAKCNPGDPPSPAHHVRNRTLVQSEKRHLRLRVILPLPFWSLRLTFHALLVVWYADAPDRAATRARDNDAAVYVNNTRLSNKHSFIQSFPP